MGYQSIGATTTAQAVLKIADDPHLPEVVCNVLRLSDIEEGKTPGPPCYRIPSNRNPGQGIGLRYLVGPVRLAVKVREKPVTAAIIAVTGVALIFALGYGAGRRKRS